MSDRALAAAAERRAGIGLAAYRLVHEGEHPHRLTVDVFDAWAVLSVFDEAAERREADVADALLGLGFRGVYVKRRPKVASLAAKDPERVAPSRPLAGEPAPDRLVVEEGGARYVVRLGAGLSTGLFLDQRDNRARVRAVAKDARVLNLFAYTCSFSVAAALGGAARVTSVDVSGDSLAWGEANFAENGLAPGTHKVRKEDAQTALARARVRGDRFDVVVLDPPSFASKKGREHDLSRDLPGLLEACARVLADRGTLLVSVNHRGTRLSALSGMTARVLSKARIETPPLPVDFPTRPGDEPFVKTVVASRG